MGDIDARYRRARPHGKALGQSHIDLRFRIEQTEQRFLFRVIGLGRITRRRADAAIGLADQIIAREVFLRGIAPELLAHTLVHEFGKGLGKPVGERLDQDRGVIVIRALEAFGDGNLLDSGGDDETANIILFPAVDRRNEIRQCAHSAVRRASTIVGAE